jgi:AraC-like DNA-binding protein
MVSCSAACAIFASFHGIGANAFAAHWTQITTRDRVHKRRTHVARALARAFGLRFAGVIGNDSDIAYSGLAY